MTTERAAAPAPELPETHPETHPEPGPDVHVVGRRVVQFLVDAGIASGIGAGASAVFTSNFRSVEYGGPTPFAVISALVITVLAWIVLFVTVPAATGGRTLGMRLTGLRVVRVADGVTPPGVGRHAVRLVLLPVDMAVAGVVGLTVSLCSEQRRRVGDLAAGTVVVRDESDRPPPGAPTTRNQARQRRRRRVRPPDPVGFVVAVMFALMALTPSLIPRDAVFQGVTSGITAAIGYGVGVLLAWPLRQTRWWSRTTRRMRHGLPEISGRAWRPLLVLSAVLLALALAAGEDGQRRSSALVGLPPPTDTWERAAPLMIAVAMALVMTARGVRWLVRAATAQMLRRTRLPRRVVPLIGLGLVAVVLALVVDLLVLRPGLRLADVTFAAQNAEIADGVAAPSDPLRSGSPASLVRWEDIGRYGRDFVVGGPDAASIAAVSGRSPVAPIRAYVGLAAADDAQARAALAVAELERTGAFGRSVLVVVTVTGTGWIDDPVADTLELMYGGDTAVVATQYSYLPSWMSFLFDRPRAGDEGRALFEAVRARVDLIAPEQRPRLLVFGESLGSQGSEGAFADLADVRARTDGALWVGPPNSNRLRAEIIRGRDAGSPEVLPVVDGGAAVRFASDPADLAGPPRPWSAPRVAYLQHASDPVTWWSPSLLWSRPDWLHEPRGRDVASTVSWFPIVTFWQVSIDLMGAANPPDGHGHLYRAATVDAWTMVAPPAGWTPADTERVREAVLER